MANQMWGGGTPAGSQPSVSSRSLTYGALREIGVLRVGSTPSPEWLDDGLSKLNQILDAWNAESLLVPSTTRQVYSLTADQQEYTLGPSGDLDGTRPPRIDGAGIVPASGDEYEVELLSDGAWPTMTIRLESAPLAGDSLAIYYPAQLEMFADNDTTYPMPQGYAIALELSLAVALAPRALLHMKTAVPAALLAEVKEAARLAVARIKRNNHRVGELACDNALVRRDTFDILRGSY
jgi:hypothetical protein